MMDAYTRNKPNLQVHTRYELDIPDGLPRIDTSRARQDPMSVPSPPSVKPLPSPLQPSSPCYEVAMRQQQRASTERLEPPLAPIAEEAMVVRVELMFMDSPIHVVRPGVPSLQSVRNGSMAERARNILLSGMTPSQASDLGTVTNRRLSAPADLVQQQRRQSMFLMQPDKLQDWGHLYLGNPTKADVFVAPSALRRPSGGRIQKASSEQNRVAIRARVRPRSKDRKPFVIARSFDLDQLQTTIPSPAVSPSSRRQSLAALSPEDVPALARTPTSPLVQSPLGRGGRQGSVAASGLRVGDGPQTRPGSKETPIRTC